MLARGVDCLSCHATAVSGDGYVSPDRCNTCHAKLEHIEKYNDLNFVHEKHVTEHKVDCLNCHTAIRHGKSAASANDTEQKCLQCHGGANSPIAAVWHGKLPGLPESPSTMARLGMNCNSCHVEPVHQSAGRKMEEHKPECSPCHAANYNALWPMWSAPLEKSIQSLAQDAKRLPAAQADTLRRALDIYRAGNPVHNPDLIAVFAGKLAGGAGAATERCVSCHAAAINMAPPWQGRNVPHSVHAQHGIGCQTCHETAEPNHGKLKLDVAQCNACHHKQATAEKCQSCHKFQTEVYSGKLDSPAGSLPSAMSEAAVGCTDCHAIEAGRVTRRSVEACVACHEPAYKDTLDAWQAASLSLLSALDQKMKPLSPTSDLHREYERLSLALRRDGSRSVHNPRLFNEWKNRIEVAP